MKLIILTGGDISTFLVGIICKATCAFYERSISSMKVVGLKRNSRSCFSAEVISGYYGIINSVGAQFEREFVIYYTTAKEKTKVNKFLNCFNSVSSWHFLGRNYARNWSWYILRNLWLLQYGQINTLFKL